MKPATGAEALGKKDLLRQLPAELAGHRTLHRLENARCRAAIVFEVLGAVANVDAGAAAQIFVIRALVHVLESSPPAHIVNKDDIELPLRVLHVKQKPHERRSFAQR